MTTNVLVLAADAYRLVDALRDYADILKVEGSGMEDFARRAAERIENAPRRFNNLVQIERFDLDAAHSAVIGVMVARCDKAQKLRDEADALDEQAKRWEKLLDIF